MEALDHVTVQDGTRLRVLRRGMDGSGRGIVLVHGLASNARLWDGVAERLSKAGHPNVAVDLRSHGRSQQTATGHSTAQAAQDVLDVAAAVGFTRPLVVGQSWGGSIVVSLASRQDLIAGAVAVDGGAIDLHGAFDGDWESARRALTPPKLAGTPADTMRARMQQFQPDFAPWAVDAGMANFEHRDDGTVAPWLPLEQHLQIVASLWETDVRAQLAAATVPTLLLLVRRDGRGSAPVPEGLEKAIEGWPHVSLRWVDDRVHDVHAQDPDLVAQQILAHLGDVDAEAMA